MSIRIIRLPDVGEGVAEAELIEWHVAVGQIVAEDQPLAEVTTDKATVEIPSPVAGTVIALGADVGTMLAVGAELIRLETAGGNADAAGQEAPVPKAPPSASAARGPQPVEQNEPAPPAQAVIAAPVPRPPTAVPRTTAAPARPPGEKPIASPAVRSRAREAGADLRRVRGSGPAGRITHDDLDAFLRDGDGLPTVRGRVANTDVKEVRVIGVRRAIAKRMAESKRRVAHFTYVEEIDVSALEDLRAALNAGGGKVKLTMLPFIMQAVVRAVAEFPQMNALYDDDADVVHHHGGVHIGIATQTSNGLMVPVVRHCEARDIWESAAEIKRLSDAARDGLATRDELSGSTITITSLGALGGIVSTPVVNRPEVAIVGTNKMMVRPVWQNGAFLPRRMMNLSSSFDHRVIDGYDAACFIQRLKVLLEAPAMLFING
jgi:2-oxoisovalerate dehydrogenase E2 component (dihydrolipoyl transacylase)